MQEREWTTVDKSEWGEGPWQGEPDKVQFEAHGLACLLHRGPGGHWCGYVGLPEGHPSFEVGCDDVKPLNPVPDSEGEWPDVHGGLTYSRFCAETDDESHGICHLPDEGEPHRVWWVGFDCAHSGDLSPKYAHRYADESWHRGDVYRTIGYVRNETIRLAAQLAPAPG